jgi:hypothetical protein
VSYSAVTDVILAEVTDLDKTLDLRMKNTKTKVSFVRKTCKMTLCDLILWSDQMSIVQFSDQSAIGRQSVTAIVPSRNPQPKHCAEMSAGGHEGVQTYCLELRYPSALIGDKLLTFWELEKILKREV